MIRRTRILSCGISAVALALAATTCVETAQAGEGGRGIGQAVADYGSKPKLSVLERLIALEEIRLVRPQFYLHLDNKQWDKMAAFLAEDAQLKYQVVDGTVYTANGRDEIVALIQNFTAPTRTFHMSTLADVQLDGPRKATAVWRVEAFFSALNAIGKVGIEYETVNERYVRVKGKWLITHLEAIVHESF